MSTAEVVLNRPIEEHEKHSFDLLASVRMMRADLERDGYILPETLERVADEEISLITEGIDRAAKTSFFLKRINGELAFFDDGKWRPYMGMLAAGLEVARMEAQADPRRKFLEEKSAFDWEIGMRMQKLRPGERLSWYSPYPIEQEVYGHKFLKECGFKPHRQMGFIYQAVGAEDGILLESHTVDRSYEPAFEAAMRRAEAEPDADILALVSSYDEVVSARIGKPVFAGRTESEKNENIWEQLLAQKDLVEYLISGLENLAESDLTGYALEEQVKRHIYGTWAAFQSRIEGKPPTNYERSVFGYECHIQLSVQQEVELAFQKFANEGRQLIGCGGVVGIMQGMDMIIGASPAQVFDAIFGYQNQESYTGPSDKFGPLKFKCPRGHWNKRPRAKSPKDFLTHCKVCRASLKCRRK